jgi:hypothetical protein
MVSFSNCRFSNPIYATDQGNDTVLQSCFPTVLLVELPLLMFEYSIISNVSDLLR